MPYVLSIISGKEKVIRAVLSGKGIDSRRTPMTGFLICSAEPPVDVRCMPHVLSMTIVSQDIADNLMNDKPAPQERKAGMKVWAVQGKYSGFYGIVRAVSGDNATVDLSVYGKMVTVVMPVAYLEWLPLPEPWG